MPTPPLFQFETHPPTLIPSKLCPFSPSSITEPSSPPGDLKEESSHTSFHKVTPEDYQLLVEERDEALKKVVYLEERLKETLEMQEVTSQKLAEALDKVDRLRIFMKKEGQYLIRFAN
jgi:hypothetical protein